MLALAAVAALAMAATAPAALAQGPVDAKAAVDEPPAAASARVTLARPAYRISPRALPKTAAEARAVLERRLRSAGRGSVRRTDIRYVLRLADRYLRRGQPPGRLRTVERTLQVNAWWFGRRGSPAQRVVVRDPDGILSTYWEGRGFAVNPVATAGRWHGLNAELAAEELAEALLPLGVGRRGVGRRFLLWEYYDVPDRPATIRPGASGMAQGRVAQLLARAYYRTGDPRYATAARGALSAFTVPVGRGGAMSLVSARAGGPTMPWYVERAYPGESPWRGAALNGFMVTLLNLRSAAATLSARPRPLAIGPAGERARERAPGAVRAGALARSLADRGARTLARYLPIHDTGDWSLYGLLTPGYPWRGFVADLNYHCYHVRLLRQLHAGWPVHRFGRTAERWAGYVRARGLSCPKG